MGAISHSTILKWCVITVFCPTKKRGHLLPLVYLALEKKNRKQAEPLTYAKQYKDFTGSDPYQCVLCGKRMVFTGFTIGSQNNELLDHRLK